MKKLLLLLFPILLAGCSTGKYGSLSDARSACANWENYGFLFEWENKFSKPKLPTRFCSYDEDTRQYLGFEYPDVKNDKVNQGFPDALVKRRFKF